MQEYLVNKIYHDYTVDEKTHVINHKINLYGKCRKYLINFYSYEKKLLAN